MELTKYTVDAVSLTEKGNGWIERYIKKMFDEGIIDETQMIEMNKYRIVISEQTFFGKLYKKDDIRCNVVKIVD